MDFQGSKSTHCRYPHTIVAGVSTFHLSGCIALETGPGYMLLAFAEKKGSEESISASGVNEQD